MVTSHEYSIFLCIGGGKILTTLHLCTDSSEPSLVTYAHILYESKEDSDETTLVHSLI